MKICFASCDFRDCYVGLIAFKELPWFWFYPSLDIQVECIALSS